MVNLGNLDWAKRTAEERWANETTVLLEAFMELERLLTKAEAMMADYHAVVGDRIDDDWEPIQDQCLEANATYLAITGPEVVPTVISRQPGIDQLHAAIEALQGFMERHDADLYGAANIIIQREEAAAKAQELERQRLAQEAERALRAQQEVAERAARAPEEARTALSSVATRIEVIRQELDSVPAIWSALLREFSRPCSTDLAGHAEKARIYLGRADNQLLQARPADPLAALELIKNIRTDLDKAEELIDALPARLKMLRELKTDPRARGNRTWTRLRDARLLAHQRNAEAKWGSVLDNQERKVKDLEKTLNDAVHPDYLAYANGLDKVDDFIQSVVAKIRS